MYCTGDPDRAPVRCTEPSGYAHTGGEAAFAALTALVEPAHPQRVDVSMQEVVFVANMAAPARYPRRRASAGSRRGAQHRPHARDLADAATASSRSACAAARPACRASRRSRGSSPTTASTRRARAHGLDRRSTRTPRPTRSCARSRPPLAEYFARHTMQELYDIACETNLMLAPANSPREIFASAQLAAREFFGPLGDFEQFPHGFVRSRRRRRPTRRRPRPHRSSALARRARGRSRRHRPAAGARRGATAAHRRVGGRATSSSSAPARPGRSRPATSSSTARRCCASSRRAGPTSCASYALGPDNPHGLEGSPMYDGLNVGKRNVTFNLKHPDAVELVQRLVVEWADAVAENFAPRAMKGFGLDYDALAAIKPDLVMISACLNGQTGPHKDYPGFGGQGSALVRATTGLTGWPDREPVGPYGTITDSLAPRFVATALAAGLHYRRRTGRGVYLDVSQVEAAIWTPVAVAARVRGRRRHRGAGRQPVDRARCRTARSRAPTRATSATAGSRSRAGPTTSGRRSPGSSGSTTRRSRRSTRAGADRRGRGGRRGVDREPHPRRGRAQSCRPRASRRCRCRTSATSTTTRSSRAAATSCRSRTRSWAPASTSATASGSPTASERLRPGRPDARPGQRLGARRAARPRPPTSSSACGTRAPWSERARHAHIPFTDPSHASATLQAWC